MNKPASVSANAYDFLTITNVVREMRDIYPASLAPKLVAEVFNDLHPGQICPADLIDAVLKAAECQSHRDKLDSAQ
ncbi:hypothetical protein ACWGTI_22800 [Mesorhizobium sp. ArgA1]